MAEEDVPANDETVVASETIFAGHEILGSTIDDQVHDGFWLATVFLLRHEEDTVATVLECFDGGGKLGDCNGQVHSSAEDDGG